MAVAGAGVGANTAGVANVAEGAADNTARLAENLLFNPLNPGGPINPTNGEITSRKKHKRKYRCCCEASERCYSYCFFFALFF